MLAALTIIACLAGCQPSPGAALNRETQIAFDTEIAEAQTAFAAADTTATARAGSSLELGQTQTVIASEQTQTVVAMAIATPVVGSGETPTVTAQPTLPPPAPTPGAEDIEVVYRDQMELEQSELVRISLVYREALTPTQTADIPASTRLIATPIPFGTPGPLNAAFGEDYRAFIVASLDGTDAFDVKPAAEKEYPLVGQERLDWQWAVAPKHEGSQVLSLMVEVRYKKDSGQQIAYPIFHKRLSINVNVRPVVFGGPLRLYDGVSGGIALIAGGVLTWLGQRIAERFAKRKPAKPRRQA